MNHGYVLDATDWIDDFEIKQNYRSDYFTMKLNSDNNPGNGMKDIYYADLRLWNTARTTSDISNFRNQLLNYIAESSSLLSSFQMLAGGATENDLGQINFGQFTFAN